MASKLLLVALVSLVVTYCTSAAPLTPTTGTSTITSPTLLDAIVRFRRSASSPEESVLVTLKGTGAGGLQVSIAECPSGVAGCTTVSADQTSVRRKRTIDMSLLLNILRVILKLFGIRIPDQIFNLLTGALGGGTQTTRTTGSTSSSSSGALNLEALLG